MKEKIKEIGMWFASQIYLICVLSILCSPFVMAVFMFCVVDNGWGYCIDVVQKFPEAVSRK